jgi:hypothetical protein
VETAEKYEPDADQAAGVGLSPLESKSSSTPPPPSAASDFLAYIQLRAIQMGLAGVGASGLGLALLLFTSGHHSSRHGDLRTVVIGVALIGGPAAISSAIWTVMSALPRARRGLIDQPLEVFLCASIRRSRFALDSASLWQKDGESAQLIAEFGRSLWSRPFRLQAHMTPAWAYAMPVKGGIVTVLFEGGGLVARVRRVDPTSPTVSRRAA